MEITWLAAALFLPLFPFTMLFSTALQRLNNGWLRALLILVWPLPGVWLLQNNAVAIPDWVLYWVLFSALLYSFRAIVIKDFSIWNGFLANSAWALCWITLLTDASAQLLLQHVLAFSLPLALLILLIAEIERRYESAYAGIVNGIASAQPRLAGLLVITVLAAIGSPVFPAFFVMLSIMVHTSVPMPVAALVIGFIWLLWSWSSMRLLQDLLVGPANAANNDIRRTGAAIYSLVLLALIVAGIMGSGRLL